MTTRLLSQVLVVLCAFSAVAISSGCKPSVTQEKTKEVDNSAEQMKKAIEQHTATATEKIDREADAAKQSIEQYAEEKAVAAQRAAKEAIGAADKADKAAEHARQAAGAAQAAANKLKSK